MFNIPSSTFEINDAYCVIIDTLLRFKRIFGKRCTTFSKLYIILKRDIFAECLTIAKTRKLHNKVCIQIDISKITSIEMLCAVFLHELGHVLSGPTKDLHSDYFYQLTLSLHTLLMHEEPCKIDYKIFKKVAISTYRT